MSAPQDASVEYNQLNIKICDFFPLGAFVCFLTWVRRTSLSRIRLDKHFRRQHFWLQQQAIIRLMTFGHLRYEQKQIKIIRHTLKTITNVNNDQ